MEHTLLGMVIVVSRSQCPKVLVSMDVMLLGIVMEAREVQL